MDMHGLLAMALIFGLPLLICRGRCAAYSPKRRK